jgi:hypothetical protein
MDLSEGFGSEEMTEGFAGFAVRIGGDDEGVRSSDNRSLS